MLGSSLISASVSRPPNKLVSVEGAGSLAYVPPLSLSLSLLSHTRPPPSPNVPRSAGASWTPLSLCIWSRWAQGTAS